MRRIVRSEAGESWVEEVVPWVAIGDRIKFTQYAGWIHEEPDDDSKYRVMHDLDVIMVFKGDSDE